jgi:ribosomal-protein-alanine N-acetyltransferase
MTVPELRTERLLLRGWRPSDLEPFAEMSADPRVMEHFPSILDRAACEAFIERVMTDFAANGFGLWAVERRADGTFLGFTGLWRPRFDAPFMPAVEVGWRYAHAAWGHGYATEAATEALRYGFEAMGLDEILSFTAPANARSIAVMERLGMTRNPADDFDHPRVPVGHPLRRHVLYRLRRRDWAGGRAGPTRAAPG